jgi:hypothetical protein
MMLSQMQACKQNCALAARVANPSAFFQLEKFRNRMIALQYVNAELLV